MFLDKSSENVSKYEKEIAQFRMKEPGSILLEDEEIIEIIQKKKEETKSKEDEASDKPFDEAQGKASKKKSSQKSQTIKDPRFTELKEFHLTIPRNYTHQTQLTDFKKKHKKEFYFYNEAIGDENFKRATNQLTPGKTYKVSIFQIQTEVTGEDCLTFLKSQNSILTGAQGLSVAYEEKKEEFPISKWTVSFDEQEALYEDAGGYRRVPYASRHSDGDWSFDLDRFDRYWSGSYCLLCFRDL